MKSMKLVLAASVLAALSSGAAHATTVATYDVTNVGNITGLTTGSINETGTAVFDDSGLLTVNLSGLTSTAAGGTFTLQSLLTFTGTLSAGTFTITGGTRTNVSCQPGTSTCSAQLRLGQTDPIIATPAAGDGGGLPFVNGTLYDANFVIAAPTENLITRTWSQGHQLSTVNKIAFTNTTAAPPAVPVPAAAWLFGSGLLGLFGNARRRRAIAVA
jgi:hypothetical protein